MVLIPTITTGKEANAMGHQLSREISGTPEVRDAEGKVIQEAVPGLFPPPLAMAFEKAMRLLVLKKKKYAAVLIDKSGELKLDEKDIMKKGIVMARRDNCKWLQKTYMKVLMHVLRREPLANAIDDLVDSIKEFMAGKVPVEDLYIIKSLGSNYASETYYMKVYGDYLRSIGKPAQPGDRLQFLIVKDLTARLLGQKMRPPDVYHDKLGTPEEEQVDHMYYIEKVLMNAMDQLIAFGYQSQIAQLSHIGYRPSNRHKMVGLSRPVKMIIHMLNSKVDIDLLKQAVRSSQVSVAPSVAPPRLTIKPLSPIKLATPPAPMVKLATPPTLPILRPASAPALKPALPQGLASPGSTSIKLRLVTTGNGGSAPSSPAVAVNPPTPGSARIPSPIMPVIAPIAAIVRSPIRLVISPSQVKLSPLRSTGPDAH